MVGHWTFFGRHFCGDLVTAVHNYLTLQDGGSSEIQRTKQKKWLVIGVVVKIATSIPQNNNMETFKVLFVGQSDFQQRFSLNWQEGAECGVVIKTKPLCFFT